MAGFDNTIMFSAGERITPSSAQDISRMQQQATDVGQINGTGSPEGVVSANPSSLYHDRTSGLVYIKRTGTGNTGWIPTPGMIIQGGVDVDFKVLDAVTTLFTTANRPFVVVGLTFFGTSVTDQAGNAFLNFGWTAPDYDDVIVAFTSLLTSTGTVVTSIPPGTTGPILPVPPLTAFKVKVAGAATATTDTENVSVIGFYI